MEAISNDDVDAFKRAKSCRNDLAYRLLSDLDTKTFSPTLRSVTNRWLHVFARSRCGGSKSTDIPINLDFSGMDIDDGEILPGPIMGIQLALGSDEQSRFYYEELRNKSGPQESNK